MSFLKKLIYRTLNLSSLFHNSSREDRLKALVEALKRNGWEVKNEPKDDFFYYYFLSSLL